VLGIVLVGDLTEMHASSLRGQDHVFFMGEWGDEKTRWIIAVGDGLFPDLCRVAVFLDLVVLGAAGEPEHFFILQ